MGQIVQNINNQVRCNIAAIQTGGSQASTVLAAGEIWLVDSTNASKGTGGYGSYDSYIVGDGTTAASALEVKQITPTDELPTAGSKRLVTSGAVYNVALQDKKLTYRLYGSESSVVDLDNIEEKTGYIHNGYFRGITGTGYSYKLVEVEQGEKIKITGNNVYTSRYCFLKSYETPVHNDETAADYCAGTTMYSIASQEVVDVVIPDDCIYMYTTVLTSGNNTKVASVEYIAEEGDIPAIEDYISELQENIPTIEDNIYELQENVSNKVDKVDGKGLIDAEYASAKSTIYDNNYIEAVVDRDGKVIEGIKSDGTKEVNTSLELNGGMTVQGNKVSTIDNSDYIDVKVDKYNRILEAINTNGEKHISKFDDSTKNLIRNLVGGDTVGGNYISIPLLDANFASSVPVEIIGTKGSDDAKYIFDLPLSEDAFNIRFEFRITENLLNQNKSAVIAKLGSSNIIGAAAQSLAQQTSSYTVNGVTKTSYWPSFTGGIRINGGQVGTKNTDHNIGLFAFSVKYTGLSENVTISNSGTAITISVDGNDTEFPFSNYPTASELYEAIKGVQDIEVSYNELEGRNSDELAVFPATKLVSSYYSTINGGRSASDVEVEYVDAAPLFVPYAVSNKWHCVEVAKINDTIYVSCNGDVSTKSNIDSNLLTLGGNCGVQFRNLEIYVNSSYDAEVVDGMLISSMNPYILVYECHGMDKTPSCESTTTGNLNSNVDRFQQVFSCAKSKGYVPVSIVDIADYYSGDKKLPKRCFTTVFDGYRFKNVMDLDNRAVFTRLNALSSLAIATSEEEPIIHDGVTVTEEVAAKICRNNGFELISHSCDHRHFAGVKPSTYIEHFSEDIYSADLLGVIGNILVFPFGENNLYILDTMKWMGFRLGIGTYSNTGTRNTYSRSRYLLTRYEIGMRASLETVMTATR